MEKHFTATGVVLKDGKTLMIKHRKLGVWLFPGGHVEPGETPDEAVLREIREETGLLCAIVENGERWDFADAAATPLATPRYVLLEDIGQKGEHFHIDMVYYCRVLEGSVSSNARETEGIGWFDQKQLETLDTYENVRAIGLEALKGL